MKPEVKKWLIVGGLGVVSIALAIAYLQYKKIMNYVLKFKSVKIKKINEKIIDFDLFLNWAEARFKDVVVKGNEIKINSIFCEDYKHHLWCNPSGGKNHLPYGVFHCWKTDTKGSLPSLIMKVDNCSFEDALEILDSTNTRLEDLEKKVAEIFEKKPKQNFLEIEKSKIDFPKGAYFLDDLPSVNYYRKNAEEGDYKNRIIIPYYNRSSELIYYNGRSLSENNSLRYLGPPKSLGVGKGDVLFVPEWPTE